jgi:hypothetical protein
MNSDGFYIMENMWLETHLPSTPNPPNTTSLLDTLKATQKLISFNSLKESSNKLKKLMPT